MGYPSLNQLPLQSMWPSSKNLDILSSSLSVSQGRGGIHKKVGPTLISDFKFLIAD
jgi:hypothetical protein